MDDKIDKLKQANTTFAMKKEWSWRIKIAGNSSLTSHPSEKEPR
jgi:hypothetical protein